MSEREIATEFPLDLRFVPVPDARVAVLVLPGGGFREHTEHDGEGYARWLNRIGVSAAVLRYRLRPDPFPRGLQEAPPAEWTEAFHRWLRDFMRLD